MRNTHQWDLRRFWYQDSSNGVHGFLYNGSTYTTLDDPLRIGLTLPTGISGGNIVGSYFDAGSTEHGFLYDGSTYTTLDVPLATNTSLNGIDGNNIVGSYEDDSSIHSFVSTLPASVVPGDYNHSGVVDAADYVMWRKGLGTTYTQNDYSVWRANFGKTASGAGSGSGAIANAAVPEPTTLVLLMFAAAGCCLRPCRHT